MDYFDKKIKATFKNEKNFVPDGFAWEEMKDGIFEKMDDKKPKKRLFIWWFIGIAATLFTIVFFAIENNVKNSQNNVTKLIIPNENSKNTISIKKSNIHPTTIENIKIENTKQSNTIKENIKFHKRGSTISSNRIVTNTNNQENNKIKYVTRSSIKNKLIKIKQVSLVYPHEINTTEKNIQIPFPITLKSNKKQNNRQHFKGIAIGINSGANTFYGIHNNASNIDKYSNNLVGYYTDLNICYSKGNWVLTSGYNFQNLVSLFEFKDEDKVNIKWKDIELIKNTNSITGTTTTIRGDATLLSDRKRNVSYYNTFKTHSVHLGIERILNINSKIDISIKGRTMYTFNIKSNGISLDESNELIYFNNGEKFYDNKQFAIGSGINMSYSFNHTLKLGLTLQADKYLSNWYKIKQANYKPTIINLGLYMKYSI